LGREQRPEGKRSKPRLTNTESKERENLKED